MRIILMFIRARLLSFRYGFSGLKDILTTEHNAWIHAASTMFVVGLSLILRISFVQFALIIVAITLVWVAEAFNTVLEIVVNMVSPDYTDVARRAKDIAAAAVLVTAIGALAIGIVILGPPLLAFCRTS